jgi:hypothetical protein
MPIGVPSLCAITPLQMAVLQRLNAVCHLTHDSSHQLALGCLTISKSYHGAVTTSGHMNILGALKNCQPHTAGYKPVTRVSYTFRK